MVTFCDEGKIKKIHGTIAELEQYLKEKKVEYQAPTQFTLFSQSEKKSEASQTEKTIIEMPTRTSKKSAFKGK